MGASGVPKSEVSRLVGELDADLAAFRERRLDGIRYPYVWLDADHEKVRESGRVLSTAFLVAIAVSEHGEREVIACTVAGAEERRAPGSRLQPRGLETAMWGLPASPCLIWPDHRARRIRPGQASGR